MGILSPDQADMLGDSSQALRVRTPTPPPAPVDVEAEDLSVKSSLRDVVETDAKEGEVKVELPPIDQTTTTKRLVDVIMDFGLPTDYRIKAMNQYYANEAFDSSGLINRILALFTVFNSYTVQTFLEEMCAPQSDLDPVLKLQVGKVLADNEQEIAVPILTKLYPTIDNSTVKVDVLIKMSKFDSGHPFVMEALGAMILNPRMDPAWRYRTLATFATPSMLKTSEEAFLPFYRHFMADPQSSIICVLTAAQFILPRIGNRNRVTNHDDVLDLVESEPLVSEQYQILARVYEIALNRKIPLGQRSTAVDILLSWPEFGCSREMLLNLIGGGTARGGNIYSDSQNAHSTTITKSVILIVDQIFEEVATPTTGLPESIGEAEGKAEGKVGKSIVQQSRELTIEQTAALCTSIKEAWEEFASRKSSPVTIEAERKVVHDALERIRIDKTLYGKSKVSIIQTLNLIWFGLLTTQDGKDRLLNEFQEMNYAQDDLTCSFGFISRIVNVLSGYDERYTVKISFRDQIIANYQARMNYRIKSIPDEELRSTILMEMGEKELSAKKGYMRFIAANVGSVCDELYNEFKEYVESADLATYLREASSSYEGYSVKRGQ